jgi:hypothetical protein
MKMPHVWKKGKSTNVGWKKSLMGYKPQKILNATKLDFRMLI